MVAKVFRSLLSTVTVILQLVAVVTATTSYASIKSNGHLGKVQDVAEYINEATDLEPLVVFQFKKFPMMREFSPSHELLPFLTNILTSENTIQLKDQSMIYLDNTVSSFETFEVLELPSSASVHLYDRQLNGKEVVLFDFQDNEYDLAKLDEFLESVCVFLEESSYGVDDVILNIKEDIGSSSPLVFTGNNIRKDHEGSKKPVDSDKLSDIWTEGLLMCLLVSFFLIILLVIAISWVGSIDISYGALEKSTNPLKKTK